MEAPQEAEVDFSEVFSVDKIAYNAKALNYCRVFVAIISGCAAGILGQTGLLGFLTFFITTFLLSLTLYMKVKGDPKPYFKDAQAIWTEGVVQSLMSYVLFWTLFYDIMYAARRSSLRALRAQASRAPCAQANEPRLRPRQIHLLESTFTELALAGRCARSRASQSASPRAAARAPSA